VILVMSTVMNGARKVTGGRPVVSSRLPLRLGGAALLVASAAIHLDLYLTGYRTIPTIGRLFLLQVIAGFVVGVLVLVTPSRLAAAAGAALALGTLGGYLLTVQFGLFGFREVRTTAGIVAGLVEVAAFLALALYAVVPDSPAVAGSPGASGSRGRPRRGIALQPGLDWRQASLGAGAVAVIALGLMGGALAGAGGQTTAASGGAGAGLRIATIQGTAVLTNSVGRTLYWFAPDTPDKSVCNGSCAVYWPPVRGPLTAAPGVTGHLGTIRRADGSVQETYDGHPLYTYVGDSGPGQAHGNNLNLTGGRWHEMTVSGH